LEAAIRDQATGSGASADQIREALDLRPIAHRLDIIEEAVLNRDGAGEKTILERLTKMEAVIGDAIGTSGGESGNGQVSQLVSDISERVTSIERAVSAEIETAAAKHQAYADDVGEVHEALMKLNQNQHTLAGSMDQWRADSASDMANIATRLANLDRDTSRPFETLNALNAHMDTMNRLLIERYHRRNRFWYWLFGTDDWIGASWPSQKEAIEAEKERVRAASA
jgi:hypothetical protein